MELRMWFAVFILVISLGKCFNQDTDDCGTQYGCFRNPSTCTAFSNCKTLVKYRYNESTSLMDITIGRQGAGWIAFGLNTKANAMDSTKGEVCYIANGVVKLNWYETVKHNIPTFVAQATDLKLIEGNFSNGAVVCRYSRPATPPGNSYMRDIHEKWYLVSAFGTVSSSNDPGYHGRGNYLTTQEAVSLKAVGIVTGGNKRDKRIVTHACLMIVAWVFFAICGIYSARFMKEAWANGKILKIWFPIHRLCMVMTVLLTLGAFILVFVAAGHFSCGDAKSHAIIGIIVTVLAFIQPFMGMLRPSPEHSKRWIFNIAHTFVGYIALILGHVNIFLGLELWKVTFGAMIAYVAVVALVFIICKLIVSYKEKREPKSRAENKLEVQEGTQPTNKFIRALMFIFGFLILFAAIITIALLVLVIQKGTE